MDVKFVNINIRCGQDGYGINFLGGAPVLVDTILSCSPAEQGGLMYGDVLVELNGNDILGLSKEAVINVIKVYNREPLRIKVARVRPIPIMSDDRKELIQVLRSKIKSGGGLQSTEVQYKHAVMNSLLEVEDLLSSFDLSPLATHKTIMPKKNTLVHNGAKPVSPNVTSKATKMSTLSDLCLELELQTYESDSLPSSSVGSSEADPGETDERLDFAHNHDPATTHRSKEDKCCISFQEDESEKTKMMKMMIKTQQGLEGIKNIMQTVHQAKEEKSRKKMAITGLKSHLEHASTVATFTPIHRERSTRDDRAGEQVAAMVRAKMNVPEHQNTETKRHFSLPAHSSAPRSDGAVQSAHVPRLSPPTKPLMSPSNKVVPPLYESLSPPTKPVMVPSNKLVPPLYESLSPPTKPVMSPSNKLVPPLYESLSPPAKTNTTSFTLAPNTRPLPEVPPILRPHPFSEKLNSASTSTPVIGSVEYPSRPQHPGGKVTGEPWVNGRGLERDQVEIPPPYPSPLAGDTTVLSPSFSPPPIIPPYNPAFPDRFPLSNKEEYVLEYKKQMHSYEDIDVNDMRRLQKDVPMEPDLVIPYSVFDYRRDKSNVPVRRTKKKDPGDSLVGEEEQMDVHMVEQRGTSSGRCGRFELEKVQDQTEAEMVTMMIVDLAPLQVACVGLPTSLYEWRLEEVMQWLKQLSPSLYQLYKSNFIKHDIIGRALLRLNASKIHKYMDISVEHSGVLAAEIVQLKIRQERMELEEMDTFN